MSQGKNEQFYIRVSENTQTAKLVSSKQRFVKDLPILAKHLKISAQRFHGTREFSKEMSIKTVTIKYHVGLRNQEVRVEALSSILLRTPFLAETRTRNSRRELHCYMCYTEKFSLSLFEG